MKPPRLPPFRPSLSAASRVLARACLALALLVPLGTGLGHLLVPRAELAWAVTSDYQVPNDAELFESRRWTYGGVLALANLGRATTGEVRILFEWAPEHVDALNRTEGIDLSPAEDSPAVVIGPMEPGHEVVVHVFGYSPYASGVTVLEDGQPVEGQRLYPPRLEAPRPWLPGWLLGSGALLLAGLGLEVLSLRRRTASEARRTDAARIQAEAATSGGGTACPS